MPQAFTFSKRSLANLQGVHQDIVAVMDEAIKKTHIDFMIIEGLRTRHRQEKLVAEGKSRTMNSRHLTGHAVDVVPLDEKGKIDWERKDLFKGLSEVIMSTAFDLGVDMEWGGDWRTFYDGPHYQLSRATYGNSMESRIDPGDAFVMKPPQPARTSRVLPTSIGWGSDSTKDVEIIQSNLRALGLLSADGVDGLYFSETMNAVTQFQTQHGITPADGLATPETQAALHNAVMQQALALQKNRTVAPKPVEVIRQCPDAVVDLVEEVGAKGMFGSKTNIAATLTGAVPAVGTVFAALGDIDPIVAMSVIACVAVVAAIYIVSSRQRKSQKGEAAQRMLKEAGMLDA